jgi:hypothetical protein
VTIASWLESIADFDPQRWFALIVCTNRGRHETQVVGAVYYSSHGLSWSPYTRALEVGEVADALNEAERAEILEWTQYVAREPIDIDGVRAFNPGDAVPTSHVDRGVVDLSKVEKHEPTWPPLARVYVQRTRLTDDQVRKLRLEGVQGWAAHGRGSLNVVCPAGCTPRIGRDDFERLIEEAARRRVEEVDLSL